MIAMGLMGTPRLIIADEPTTALDVTVQQQMHQAADDVGASTGAAVILISHDIAVVSQICQRVLVMYAGRIVEDLPVSPPQPAAAPSLHARAAGEHCRTWDAARAAAGDDPRPPAGARGAARRLPVRRPLRLRQRHVSDRGPGPRRTGDAASPAGTRGPARWRREPKDERSPLRRRQRAVRQGPARRDGRPRRHARGAPGRVVVWSGNPARGIARSRVRRSGRTSPAVG